MEGLHTKGQRIKVWPDPSLKVQASSLSLLEGGRWMKAEGEMVTWDAFRYRQLLAGEIHLHDPRPNVAPAAATAPSLARDVEVAERRASIATAAKEEAERMAAEAKAAAERAEAAAKAAEEANTAAIKSTERLANKLAAGSVTAEAGVADGAGSFDEVIPSRPKAEKGK